MRNSLCLLMIVNVLSRILKSDRRGFKNRHSVKLHDNINGNTVHDDPDHVDVDLRHKKNNHGRRNLHTGTVIHVRRKNVHHHHHSRPNTAEEIVKNDMKKATGARKNSDLSVVAKTLAREAAKGNSNATRALRDNGGLTEPFASDLIDAQEKSPLTGLTPDEVEKALRETPHTSAPMKYSSMKEVKPGDNPELDKTLKMQKLMDWFRSFLPKSGGASDQVMQGASDILDQAPNGDISAPFVDPQGNLTGRTYGQEAESYVKNAAPLIDNAIKDLMDNGLSQREAENQLGMSDIQNTNPITNINQNIDQAILGNVQSPSLTAASEYENLIMHGVTPDKAKQLAARIGQSVQNQIAEKTKLADALKENAKESFDSANHQQLISEIEQEKESDQAKMIKTMNEETERQKFFPVLHPIHLNADELSYLRQIGNQIPPKEIGRHMYAAYALTAQGGGTPDDALKAAARTGYILSEYNNEIRKGVPPNIATNLIQERAEVQDAVEQRRSFVQNNGPEIAQLVAENTKLVEQAAAKIASDPDRKDDVLNDLDNEMKALSAKHAKYIHTTSNMKHIHRPRKAADDLIDETQSLNSELLHIANDSPIVAKDIIKKGLDNARETAEMFNQTLSHVDEIEKKRSPIPKSALKLLDEAKKEQQLDEIARKSADAEKKRKEQLAKEHKDAEVMATEEQIAKENRTKKIENEGIKAAEKVLQAGGTIGEAKAAKAYAEKSYAQQLQNKDAVLRQNVLKTLSNGVDPQKAAKIASHFATAHSGENAVGKTRDEVINNEIEERKKEALEKAFYSDFSNEKVDIVKVIPPDSTEINIDNSVVKFPLNTFIDEKPKDKGEEFVKNRTDVLNNIIRNTVTRNEINSGLNTIQTIDGYLNMGENSNKIHVQKAVAYIKPSGKLQMEKEGIDTSNWKSKHNQGERPDIPNGELYYEAEVNNADIPLPSPINKTPGKFISNADEQLDADYIDELHIKTGSLEQVPWNEFSDVVKPRLNLYPNEEERIKEANLYNDAMAEQRKKEKLDSIKIYTFTNPDGEKHITTVPQYGLTETFEEDEGMQRLANVDPDKNIALSETPTEIQKEPMINSLDNVPDDQVMGNYIDNTIAEGKAKHKTNRFISPINGFTEQYDATKAAQIQTEKFDASKYLINDNSEASRVKNDLINHTAAYSKALGIDQKEYVDLIKRIPDSTIYKMDKFNSEPASNPTKILDQSFSQSLNNMSSNISVSNLISYIFSSISEITGNPNNVSSTLLEQQIIPNLKAVETTTTYKTPNGSFQTQTIEPPKPGNTTIAEVTTNGTPRIATGPNTGYNLPDPTKPPIRPIDNVVRNPGGNPLSPAQGPYSQGAGGSFNVPINPANAIGSSVPEVSPPNQQRPSTNAPKASPPAPVGRAPPANARPRPLTSAPTPPGSRLGIASSPLK